MVPAKASQSATLAWNPDIDSSVVGYHLYYGTLSGGYTQEIDEGNATTATVTGLATGITYYFVVTAYTANGQESAPSNEASFGAGPLAVNDSAVTFSNASVVIDALANDQSPDGGPLTIIQVTQPADGTAVINPDKTITYTPGAGFTGQDSFFYTISNGEGGTSSATITVINPLLGGHGNFYGLITNPAPTAGNVGSIQFAVQPTGKFTGKATVGAQKVQFLGAFDENGNATITISKGLQTPIVLTLQINANKKIAGIITQGAVFTSSISASIASYSKNPSPLTGAYTALLPPNSGTAISGSPPQGYGFGRIVVNRSGTASFSGKLADNTGLSFSATIGQDGTLSVFARLYSGKGFAIGTVTFAPNVTPGSETDFSGILEWLKPQSLGGFSTSIAVIGSTFVAPAANQPALTSLPMSAQALASVILTSGALPRPIVKQVTFAANQSAIVQNPGSDQLGLKMNAKTGLITGSFYDAAIHTKRNLSGVVFQKQSFGAGFFLGQASTSGSVVLAESP